MSCLKRRNKKIKAWEGIRKKLSVDPAEQQTARHLPQKLIIIEPLKVTQQALKGDDQLPFNRSETIANNNDFSEEASLEQGEPLLTERPIFEQKMRILR